MIPDPSKLWIRGLKNGRVLQDCGTEYEQIPFPQLHVHVLTLRVAI